MIIHRHTGLTELGVANSNHPVILPAELKQFTQGIHGEEVKFSTVLPCNHVSRNVFVFGGAVLVFVIFFHGLYISKSWTNEKFILYQRLTYIQKGKVSQSHVTVLRHWMNLRHYSLVALRSNRISLVVALPGSSASKLMTSVIPGNADNWSPNSAARSWASGVLSKTIYR